MKLLRQFRGLRHAFKCTPYPSLICPLCPSYRPLMELSFKAAMIEAVWVNCQPDMQPIQE